MRNWVRIVIAAAAIVWPSSARAGAARHYWRHTTCRTTGYLWTGYRTATGTWPREHHTVATLPQFIPYGATVRLAGLPWRYRVEDTGGLTWGQVDIYVTTLAEAYGITGYRPCWWTI